MITIRETGREDLENIRLLWKNGDVMMFFGFPDGIDTTDEDLEEWLAEIREGRPLMTHFSAYSGETYRGEAFFGIDPETKRAELDIKLLPDTPEGEADEALGRVIELAFAAGAEKVCASVSPLNERAAALFERSSMIKKDMPAQLGMPGFVYYEIESTPAAGREE